MDFSLSVVQRNWIKDYILIMLGAPVVKVELDPQQIELAIDASLDVVRASQHDKVTEANFYYVVRRGAIAHAKIVLGRIRSKFSGENSSITDGTILLNEGREELMWWEDELLGLESDEAADEAEDE